MSGFDNVILVRRRWMRRRLVESASVRSAGYDGGTRTLELEYVNGSVYQYYDVPQPTYAGLLAAPSIGAYVNAEIKPNYEFAEV
jgi:KTSC domain